jgi:hypothetical protein
MEEMRHEGMKKEGRKEGGSEGEGRNEMRLL